MQLTYVLQIRQPDNRDISSFFPHHYEIYHRIGPKFPQIFCYQRFILMYNCHHTLAMQLSILIIDIRLNTTAVIVIPIFCIGIHYFGTIC